MACPACSGELSAGDGGSLICLRCDLRVGPGAIEDLRPYGAEPRSAGVWVSTWAHVGTDTGVGDLIDGAVPFDSIESLEVIEGAPGDVETWALAAVTRAAGEAGSAVLSRRSADRDQVVGWLMALAEQLSGDVR